MRVAAAEKDSPLASFRRRPILATIVLLIALILLFLVLRIGIALYSYPSLFPNPVYYQLAVAYLVLGGALPMLAYAQRDRWSVTVTGLLLAVSAIPLLLGVSDLYILSYRNDTAGPGPGINLTHRNWQERHVTSNAERFWERDLTTYYANTGPQKIVIAAVGDSFTWGQGMPGEEFRYTNILQDRLRRGTGADIDVLNISTGGGSTKTETEWIETILAKIAPKVVIVFYLTNDIDALDLMRQEYPTYDPLPLALLAGSPTLNFLFWKTLAPAMYGAVGQAYFYNLVAAYTDAAHFGQHLDDIGTQIAAIRAIGAKPVFAILPFPHMWAPVTPAWRDRIYAAIAQRARDAGANVIELQDIENQMSPAEFELNPVDGHPNPAVHALIAERVHAWFAANPDILE